MMARSGGTNPFCLQVFFLTGRLDRACAFRPWEDYPMPSSSFTSADLLHVGKSALIEQVGCHELPAQYDRNTRGYASTWDSLLMGVVWA